MKKYDHKIIRKFIYKNFSLIGLNKTDTDYVTDGLVNASLRGVDSHGIRLFKHYILSGLNGRKSIKPKYTYHSNYKTSLLLNANNGYGLAACRRALEKSLPRVDKYGMTSVGIINSSHCGCLASSVIPIVKKGYIVFGFTHADSLLLSYGSKKSFFGTNPLCFGYPRSKKEPFCLDMSPSLFSWNKVLTYRKQNKKLPQDICTDDNGKMTTNPHKAKSLIPIGGYKGYGLSAMIEILCSINVGMNFGKKIPPMFTWDIKKTRNLGQYFIVMKSDLFINKNSALKNLEKLYSDIYKLPRKSKNKRILLPNDKETNTLNDRKKNGIPITKEVREDFKYISNILNLDCIF